MLLLNLLIVNHKCFSVVDLLHRLHCIGYNYMDVMSANKHG